MEYEGDGEYEELRRAMLGFSCISSMIRLQEAVPRCIRFTTHPSAIMGQISMPM